MRGIFGGGEGKRPRIFSIFSDPRARQFFPAVPEPGTSSKTLISTGVPGEVSAHKSVIKDADAGARFAPF
jgi:hypothetical protein